MKNSIIKSSLITTILNEENSIKNFLDSIKSQVILPSEVVIVDGGSKDNTIKIVNKFIKDNNNLNIKLYTRKGNRSIGRNGAISLSGNEIVAISDAGCILDKNWLKEITTPFLNDNVDVVAGYYKPIAKNIFQKCLSTYTCVMEDRLKKDFLPSSRSVAFKKSAWKKVNGYPENLDTCEDLVFAKTLKQAGFKFSLNKKAIVYWPQRENILQAFWQFYGYAKGDGQAHYFRKTTPLLFARVLLFLSLVFGLIKYKMFLYILIPAAVLYIFWSILKNYRYIKRIQAFVFLPSLQIFSDIAVFTGTLLGLAKSTKLVVDKGN